jgi:hypothetical protein
MTTDASDIAQLLTFIQGVNNMSCHVITKLLSMEATKGTTGEDFY